MPAEDRDRQFENAMARQLRADAAAGDSACLDPELLATYHERMLAPEEMTVAKEHVISCARCQEILAQLEATDTVQALQNDQADLVMSAASSRSAVREVVEEAGNVTAPAPVADEPKSRIVDFPSRKNVLLRWAAPLGAVAAVLLLWIGSHGFRVYEKAPVAAPVQTAENRSEDNLHAQPQTPPATPQGEQQQNAQAIQPGDGTARLTAPPTSALKAESSNAPANVPEGARSSDENYPAPSAPSAEAKALDQAAASDGFGVGAGLAPQLRDEMKDSVAAGKLKQRSKKPPATTREYYANSPHGFAPGPGAAAGQAQAANAVQQSGQLVGGRADEQVQVTRAVPVAPELDKVQPQAAPAPVANSAISGASAQPAAPPPPSSPRRVPGYLNGAVTDPSGAAVADAKVALKSENGNTVALTSTDGSGMYSFNAIAVGNYQLELQKAGFKTDTVTGLNIAVGENVMNAQLQLGASTETVEVAAHAAPMQTQASANADVSWMSINGLSINRTGLNIQIPAPDGKKIWSLGPSGQILFSKDGGHSWLPQASGVSANLTGGSAPTDRVCWIAGAAGTLLLTKDGGKHWEVVATPIAGDLGGVRATDAKHASIWDLPHRVAYETADGGATWKQSANE
jgi:hypothetical protein